MRPMPRVRKTVKWGGAVACLLLLAAWAASLKWHARWTSSNGLLAVSVGKGAAGFVYASEGPPIREGWLTMSTPRGNEWWFDWGSSGAIHWIIMPLWSFAAMPLVPSCVAWILDSRASRRNRVGLCPSCGYDQRGLPPRTPCPECGA